jgi:cell division protein FtsW (lipid II flippase)
VLAVLRAIGLTVAIALAFMLIVWLVTGERRWLRRAWITFKYAVFGLAFVLLLFAGEALLRA